MYMCRLDLQFTYGLPGTQITQKKIAFKCYRRTLVPSTFDFRMLDHDIKLADYHKLYAVFAVNISCRE